jgi:hypothetical protein
MDNVPFDILAIIGALLPRESLCNFRLTSRDIAVATTPIIGRHLAVLNAGCCLEEFQFCMTLNRTLAKSTRHLTIYHATWPICTRRKWAVHPLLLGGNERFGVPPSYGSIAANNAFQGYRRFIFQESNRDPSDLVEVFRVLPSLTHITIDHIRKRRRNRLPCFDRLRRTIWLEPNIRDFIGVTVQNTLQSISCVTVLNIKGPFTPDEAFCGRPPTHVTVDKLEVCSLKVCENGSLQDLILGFQNLRRISLRTDRRETLPLCEITCDRLEKLELSGWCVAESSLIELISRHSFLFSLDISGVTLTGGTWAKVLAQAHAAKVSVTFSQGQDPGFGPGAMVLPGSGSSACWP